MRKWGTIAVVLFGASNSYMGNSTAAEASWLKWAVLGNPPIADPLRPSGRSLKKRGKKTLSDGDSAAFFIRLLGWGLRECEIPHTSLGFCGRAMVLIDIFGSRPAQQPFILECPVIPNGSGCRALQGRPPAGCHDACTCRGPHRPRTRGGWGHLREVPPAWRAAVTPGATVGQACVCQWSRGDDQGPGGGPPDRGWPRREPGQLLHLPVAQRCHVRN
eukprot:1139364-Rhodomonas_salina.3